MQIITKTPCNPLPVHQTKLFSFVLPRLRPPSRPGKCWNEVSNFLTSHLHCSHISPSIMLAHARNGKTQQSIRSRSSNPGPTQRPARVNRNVPKPLFSFLDSLKFSKFSPPLERSSDRRDRCRPASRTARTPSHARSRRTGRPFLPRSIYYTWPCPRPPPQTALCPCRAVFAS